MITVTIPEWFFWFALLAITVSTIVNLDLMRAEHRSRKTTGK